jgi:hypothetical protein
MENKDDNESRKLQSADTTSSNNLLSAAVDL